MFFKGMHLGSLLLIFLIMVVLFGTRRLREFGNDLGEAVKNFRKSLQDDDHNANKS